MSARWDDATADRLDALRAASGLPRMGAVELQHDGVHGVLVGPADRLAQVVRPEAVVGSAMTTEQAHAEIGWVAQQATRWLREDPTGAEVLEYYTRKAAVLEHIASTQHGAERRETEQLAADARAEVAARTTPTGPAPTRGEQLAAIGADLDRTTAAWVTAGYPLVGPTADAREAVFARLRAWNEAS